MTIDEMHLDKNAAERAIVLKIIEDALEAGCLISIDNGAARTKESTNKAAIFAWMFSTGEDTLYFHREGQQVGWVWLIYGNGCDVISDHCDNAFTTELLAPAMALAETFE